MTHTYVLLEISKEAYEEISSKLKNAGYDMFGNNGEINMHGIALIQNCVQNHTPEDDWDRAMDIVR